MGIVYRISETPNTVATNIKNFQLTYEEADGNMAYLLTNMSGSNVSISGSTRINGNTTISSSLSVIGPTTIAADFIGASSTVLTVSNNTHLNNDPSSDQLGTGIAGYGDTGVYGVSDQGKGVYGYTSDGTGVFGEGVNSGAIGVLGIATNTDSAGVDARGYIGLRVSGSDTAIQATGPVTIAGNTTITGSAIISGSLTASGSIKFPNLTVSQSLSNVVMMNPTTGQLYYTASVAILSGNFGSVITSGSTLYSSDPATSNFNTISSIFLGSNAGQNATNANDSNFLGQSAGQEATNANDSNFLGQSAGQEATNAYQSNFLGLYAGYQATNANVSNFIGQSAGNSAINAANSNFLGNSAGYSASNAYASNFIGTAAGYQATNANVSNFIGNNAGYQATNASYSNFIGLQAGYQATSASYSTLIGYQVGLNGAGGALGVKSNNIIIGTNISLPDCTKDSINLGGIIFATGSYSTTAGNLSSGSQYGIGKVGINIVTPQFTLDVSGSGRYTAGLTVSGSFNMRSGSNASVGTAQLAGTPGTVLVPTTAVTANSKIFVGVATGAGTRGFLNANNIIPGTSFAISSSANETSTVNWFIVN